MTATNDAIMHKLGGIEAQVSHAETSRQIIHEKIDAQAAVLNETVKRLQEVGFTLKVTTDVAVQARDKIDRFDRDFHDHSKPLLEDVAAFRAEAEPVLRMMKTVRNIVVALAGAGALTLGSFIAAVAYAGETVKAMLRWYLGG